MLAKTAGELDWYDENVKRAFMYGVITMSCFGGGRYDVLHFHCF